MNGKIKFLSALFCFALSLSTTLRAAATDKIGLVIECESISRFLADIKILSDALGLQLQDAKTERMLADAFSSQGLAGINSNESFMACVIIKHPASDSHATPSKAPARSQPVVLILPVTGSGDAYMKSVGKSYGKTAQTRALTHFSQPAGEKPTGNPDIYIGISGKKAVVSPDPDNVELTIASLSTLDTWKKHLAAVPGTLRIGIDMPAVIPPVESTMQMITAMIRQMPQQPAAGGSPAMANPAQILEAEGDILLAIMKQLKSHSIGIGLNGKAIEINTLTVTAPGSPLAAILGNVTPVSGKYAASMPANALISIVGNGINIIDIFIEPYGNMMEKMFGAMGPGGAAAAKQMKNIVLSMKGTLAGEYAIGVFPGATANDIGLVEMFSVNNPEQFRKTITESIEITSAMYSNIMPGMSMTLGKARASGGVDVLPYTCSYKPASNAIPQAAMAANLNFFQNYNAEIAFPGKDVIYTMGGGPGMMDAALARQKNGGARIGDSKAFASLFPRPPSNPASIHSMELAKLIKSFVTSLPNGEQLSQMIPDSNSGLAGYSRINGNDIASVTRIGLDEIAGLKNALPAVGLLMMPAILAGANPQGAGSHGGADTKCLNNLRMLDAAKEQCALEKGLKNDAAVEQSSLSKYLLRGKMPACPAGGTYTLNPIGSAPTCSTPGHALK